MQTKHPISRPARAPLYTGLLRVAAAGACAWLLAGSPLAYAAEPAAPPQPPTAQIHPPSSANMQFNVQGRAFGFGYSASAVLDWQREGNHYQARQSVRIPILGNRTQTSSGNITPTYLQPLVFTDSSRKQRDLRFNPEKNQFFTGGSDQPQFTPAGAQDRLSVFFQLASIIASDPARRVIGQEIPIWTVASNKQEAWVFKVESLQPVDLPAGRMPAIMLQRMPRDPHDQIAQIWLSPAIGYLPVKINFKDDSDSVELSLAKYTPAPAQADSAVAPHDS